MKQKLSFIYLLLSLTLSSQNIQIDKLDIKNGLPDNSVSDIIQDHQGYLWLGTLNGLSRFDGNSFKNYYSIPGDTTSLNISRIVKIKEDKKGFIWCWSDSNNMHRVNPITNEVLNLHRQVLNKEILIKDFKIFSNGDMWVWGNHGCARIKYIDDKGNLQATIFNKENGFENNIVHFVFEDKQENIWIGTETGLVRINFSNQGRNINTYFKNKKFICFNTFENNIWFGTQSDGIYNYSLQDKTFNTFDDLNSEFVNTPILKVFQLNSKAVLLGSSKLLFEFDIQNNLIKPIYNENYNGVSEFYSDSFNNTWLVAEERGIFKYSHKSKTIKYYDLNAKERKFSGINDRLKILEDSNKNLWIGVYGGGLFLYNRHENEFINYKANEEKIGNISSDRVLTLFEDSSKNLWVGTMYGGVNKINILKDNFIWHRPIKTPNNVFENEIRTSVEDRKGNLWLGSIGGKIFCYENYKIKYTFPDDLSNSNKQKLKDINVYSLYIDQDDNLWVGTKGKGKGVFVLKDAINTPPKDLEIVHFDVNESSALNDIYSIVQDKNKNYWLGSYGFGLALLSNPFSSPQIVTYSQGVHSNQLISDFVRYLFIDYDDNLWVGTSHGLNLLTADELNAPNKKFISFENKKEDITTLSYNSVDHIFQASNKNIYVSTMGGGLNVLSNYNIKDKIFKWSYFDVSRGLSSNKVFAMEEDLEKNIWISTSLGLNKYYPKEEKFENFFVEREYGLNYFTEGCVSKLSNGDMLFGHHKGFLTFNPKYIIKDTTTYPIVLSKFFVNGNEELPRKSNIIDKNIEYENGVKLSYMQNTIRFDFSVLDYKKPEKIQYSYKLDNFDEKWSTPLTSNTAIYQNLPHGKYTFLLKATNSDGVELADILKFNVNITPPFLKSYLGYFIVSVLFGIIFYSFLYLYKRQLSAKHEVLFTDKLNEKKLIYYTNISHEFKTPLALISCHLEDIIDDEKVSKQTKSSTKQIQKHTNYLLNLVEQILDFRKIRENKKKLYLVNTDIVNFIKNIHSQFLPLANKEHIELVFISKEKEMYGYMDVKMMKKVIYNLISNAVKFTPENKKIKILVDFKKHNDFVKIRIKDQGIGISEDDQKNLFERFYKSENSSGIGLFYVKELVNTHNGTIEVDSVLNIGTCFTINLPINKKYYSQDKIEIKEEYKEINIQEPSILDDISMDDSLGKDQLYSILIIEDNTSMREYLSKKFKQSFKVFSASNGREGLEKAIKEIPDIIVCDYMMPVMDGIETIRLLRENFNTCHIPIILLTANSSEQKQIEGIKIGADDYITKPFNFKYLKLKIDALISQRNIIIQSFSKNPELSLNILTNSDEDKNFIEKVKQIIEESIGEADFGVNNITSKMGLSRTIFYKKMKDITGETPHKFISTIQMKKAALLLKNTNYTISEIGLISGFNDTNYFSKIFKKYFGTSPKAYQLEHRVDSLHIENTND